MSAPPSIVPCLLAATMLTAAGAYPAAAQQTATGQVTTTEQDQIVITATRERRAAVEGVEPERSVDADAVASYGASTIGEVLAEIAAEMGEGDEEPALYVNGVPIADPGDIVDYPSEAIERIDVLPRGAGARLGAGTDRRAYNIVLRQSFGSVTGTLSNRFATAGGFNAATGEVFITRIAGQRRFNISARIADESLLRESERGIVQPDPPLPFAAAGNIVPAPGFAEIDPALSALAGMPVTIAALDGGAPTLGALAANANRANITDLGAFRSLLPATRRYALGFTGNMPLADWLGAALTARWERDVFRSLQGLRGGLFVLPASNPLSPFSRDVGVAIYADNVPLRQRTALDRASIDLTLNAQRGDWLLSLRGGHRLFGIDTDSERQDNAPTSPIVLADGDNPFAGDVSGLLPVSLDSSRSRTNTSTAQLLASGPLFALPAGEVRASFTAGWTHIEQSGRTRSRFFESDRDIARTEWQFSESIELPLIAPDMADLGWLGELSAQADYAVTHVPGLGEVERSGFGLAWKPVERLEVRLATRNERLLPDPQQVGEARTVTENVRYFDPVRLETVDVTQIGGGNPALRSEKTQTTRLSAALEAWRAIDLRLTGELLHTGRDDLASYLPPSSADIVLAFPDRFIRDAEGRLRVVDIRPVNFVGRSSEQLRWGATFAVPLSPGLRRDAEGNLPHPVAGAPRWRLQGAFNHVWELADEAVLRAGLPALDLLDGGAIGFAGAGARHRLDGSLALNDRELGVRLSASWRGESYLNTGTPAAPARLTFGDLATVDLRAFADLGQVWPERDWLKKTRLTVTVNNLFNSRQTVFDAAGAVPLRYQPGYRDPLGRTVEFELRRQF